MSVTCWYGAVLAVFDHLTISLTVRSGTPSTSSIVEAVCRATLGRCPTNAGAAAPVSRPAALGAQPTARPAAPAGLRPDGLPSTWRPRPRREAAAWLSTISAVRLLAAFWPSLARVMAAPVGSAGHRS